MLLDYLGLSYQSHYDENKFKRPISVSCRPLLSSTAKTAFSIGTMWLLMCLLRIENHIFHHCWDKRRSALPVTEWSEGVNATSERPFIWVCVSVGLWRGIAVFPDCPVYINAIDLLSSWFSQMLFEAPVAVSGCVTILSPAISSYCLGRVYSSNTHYICPNASAGALMALQTPPFLSQRGKRNEKWIGLFNMTSIANFARYNVRLAVKVVNWIGFFSRLSIDWHCMIQSV